MSSEEALLKVGCFGGASRCLLGGLKGLLAKAATQMGGNGKSETMGLKNLSADVSCKQTRGKGRSAREIAV